jgi:hypothetical protein
MEWTIWKFSDVFKTGSHPLPTPPPQFQNYFNNILPSMTRFFPMVPLLQFPHQTPVRISPLTPSTHACHMPHPSQPQSPWSDHRIFYEGYNSWSSSLCSFLQFPVTSSRSPPNTFLSTLFSNTLKSVSASLHMRDQVSHPYKATGKATVQCVLIPAVNTHHAGHQQPITTLQFMAEYSKHITHNFATARPKCTKFYRRRTKKDSIFNKSFKNNENENIKLPLTAQIHTKTQLQPKPSYTGSSKKMGLEAAIN